jgi:hypothetical protein
MITNNCVEVGYIHRLTEDIGDTLKAGISVRRTSGPGKLESYAAFNGMEFVGIPREKVQVYQVTTRTITEEVLVEDEQS